MKKTLLLFIIGFFGFAFWTHAQTTVPSTDLEDAMNQADQIIANLEAQYAELQDAIAFLYTNGITIHNNVSDFKPNNSIRRDAAAKMYTLTFQKFFASRITNGIECPAFDDIGLAINDLKPIVNESCKMGLFKGRQVTNTEGTKTYFTPNGTITNGQAVVVLIRMMEGNKDETNVKHYAESYIARAEELGFLTNLNITDPSTWDNPATRGTIALLLFRAIQGVTI